MKNKKIKVISLIVVAMIAVCSTVCVIVVKDLTETTQNFGYTVVIDVGHGGIDGGVVGVTGSVEKDLNLNVSLALKDCFVRRGINVVMTRETDVGLYGVLGKGFKKREMKKRKEIILSSDADVVISVHMNSYKPDTSRRGAQVFYRVGDEICKSFANRIQNRLNGMQESSRPCDVLAGDYYVLNCSDKPSVLVECCFISNPEDERLIKDKDYVTRLAEEITVGTVEFLSA